MPENAVTDLNTPSDDEYEYEYSTTETESFYIHLDLSSVNGVLKSSNATNRRLLGGSQTSKSKKSKSKTQARDVGMNTEGQDEQDPDQEAGQDHNPDEGELEAQAGRGGNVSAQEGTAVEDDDGASDSIQIMALHSDNPVVSYRNQIYSCVWTDTIGTSMFFSKHNEAPIHDPEIATEDYDLLGTSRVKLVGYKATVTPIQPAKDANTTTTHAASYRSTPNSDKAKPQSQEEGDETAQNNSPAVIADEDTDDTDANENHSSRRRSQMSQPGDISEYVPANYLTTGPRRSDPHTQSHTKRQALFLEKLKDIKRQRGEHDKVRTFVDRYTLDTTSKQTTSSTSTPDLSTPSASTSTSAKPTSGRPNAATAKSALITHQDPPTRDQTAIAPQTRREIEDLNARVVRGDTQALERLQEIYAQIEEVRSDED